MEKQIELEGEYFDDEEADNDSRARDFVDHDIDMMSSELYPDLGQANPMWGPGGTGQSGTVNNQPDSNPVPVNEPVSNSVSFKEPIMSENLNKSVRIVPTVNVSTEVNLPQTENAKTVIISEPMGLQ
jgi:hypothetical protein